MADTLLQDTYTGSTPPRRLFLTRWLGANAGLVQGDPLVLDRWLWLKARLPRTANNESLIDVGCGTGAFTIKAALRGYDALGLTWGAAEARVAAERASVVRAQGAKFRICDVRSLDEHADLRGAFDFAICCENIEHIIDDRRLARAIHQCLRPGGRLLLTAPNYHYRPIRGEIGPFSEVEDGGHVRRGYSAASVRELVEGAGFLVEQVDYVSGFFSQKTAWFLRLFAGRLYGVGWLLTLPLRPLIPAFDRVFHTFSRFPKYSIAVEAYKRRT